MNRYRSREDLVADVAAALASTLTVGSKYALLDNICWTWSEFDGKLEGCRWWTAAALASRDDPSSLRHEHVVPRRVIIEHLLSLGTPTVGIIRQIMDTWCIAAVVTTEEDRQLRGAGLTQRMPRGWDGKDAWARYRAAGIAATDISGMAGA